jgi:hypothetical protein
MKTKISLIVIGLISSLISIVSISSANAECNASDPCGTWAMVDNQGTVTNVIVCQASVCGAGEWAGQRVVPQVAPNPVTHDTYGTSGFNTDQNQTVREVNSRFYIENNIPQTSSTIEVNSNEETVSTIVTVSQTVKSFTYEDTINKEYGQILMRDESPSENTSAEITVNKKFLDKLTEQEKIVFLNRQTSDEIKNQIVIKQFTNMMEKINIILQKLGKWVK